MVIGRGPCPYFDYQSKEWNITIVHSFPPRGSIFVEIHAQYACLVGHEASSVKHCQALHCITAAVQISRVLGKLRSALLCHKPRNDTQY